mmetsp:Transcript_14462/g.22074  ORF Transcript_14462/g.22074 Transcript_14462/m.22074 type:complete len:144 (+) Transcript_14462:183-614(+)
MIHAITTSFRHRKAIDTSKEQFLPEDPSNSTPPSPHYHSIVGDKFIYLDWKLLAPKEKLCCYICMERFGRLSHLQSLKTNIVQNRTLFPLWTGTGRPTLPAHIRDMYPVAPTHATGAFHFHTQLCDDVDDNMMTSVSNQPSRL